MKRILLIVTFLLCYSALRPAVTYADCAATETYSEVVLGIQPTHLIGYWQLSETTGTTAEDSSGNNYDGTYSGPALAAGTFLDSSPAPTFDGVNDYVNIYSSGLSGVFSSSTGTASIWMQMSSTNWNNSTRRRALVVGADTNNRILITKSNAVNTVQAGYISGGTQNLLTFTKPSDNYFNVVVTWSKSNDRVKVYLNGTQSGSTLTGMGTWSGSLSSSLTVIGAVNTTPSETWVDGLAHIVLWKTELTASEVAALATVPGTGPTPTPCPTSTPTATPSYYVELETPEGLPARVERSLNVAQYAIILVLVGILFSLWQMYVSDRLRRRK